MAPFLLKKNFLFNILLTLKTSWDSVNKQEGLLNGAPQSTRRERDCVCVCLTSEMATCLEYLAGIAANFMFIAEIVFLFLAIEDVLTEIPESLIFIVLIHLVSWLYLMFHTVSHETYEYVQGHLDLDYATGCITKTQSRRYTTITNVPGWKWMYLNNWLSAAIIVSLLHGGVAAGPFIVVLLKN